MHAATLTSDLQRSRMRLVTAREEERRRLRRDLHDGLGPTLAGLALKAGTVADLISLDPETAQRAATALYGEIRATIGEIRRLVYGLRPPSLDELGLAGAVRDMARRHSHPGGADTTVVVDGELSALPAASRSRPTGSPTSCSPTSAGTLPPARAWCVYLAVKRWK